MHWDPELSNAVIAMRRERWEGGQRLAQAKQAKEAEEQREEEEMRKAASRKNKGSLIQGPESLTRFKQGVFEYATLPKAHAERTRQVTSAGELFNDIDEQNLSRTASVYCPRRPRPSLPTDWKRVGYGGNGIDTKANGMYTDTKDQYTTTMNAYYPQIIYAPNAAPRRHVCTASEQAAKVRQQRIAHLKKTHEAHIERIMHACAVEHYDKKMMDDARVKSKMGQALGHLMKSHEQDYYSEMQSSQASKKTCRKAAKKIFGGHPDQQFNILMKERKDDRDFQTLFQLEFCPLNKRLVEKDGKGVGGKASV